MTPPSRDRGRLVTTQTASEMSTLTDAPQSTERTPQCPRCGHDVSPSAINGPVQLGDYLDHFRWRVLQDGLAEATAAYWLKRAEDFEKAKPIEPVGGYATEAAAAQAALQWRRCDETARACRNAASLAVGRAA